MKSSHRPHGFSGILRLLTVLVVAALLIAGAAGAWLVLRPTPQEPDVEELVPSSNVPLTPEQRAAADIAVSPIREIALPRVFRAPGEVMTNDYTTHIVAPRITATVIMRSARLGDRVESGQQLVTLYSMEMAEAQSAFLLAQRNLERLETLSDIVAGQQIDEATVNQQETRGRLESYGLTDRQIAALVERGLANDAIGQFVLTASETGTITKDEFRLGDVVDPGKMLFEIADLSEVWVEAKVSPALLPEIKGDRGKVIAGGLMRDAPIVQKREIVDEVTRTVGVRLQVGNQDGALKPGQFVDVELYGDSAPVLAVPTAAVLTDESGQPLVYIETGNGSFESRNVTPLYASGDQTAIAGIPEGTPVVTSGAFFVRSEAAKATFGDDD